jgi:hypothetical protein
MAGRVGSGRVAELAIAMRCSRAVEGAVASARQCDGAAAALGPVGGRSPQRSANATSQGGRGNLPALAGKAAAPRIATQRFSGAMAAPPSRAREGLTREPCPVAVPVLVLVEHPLELVLEGEVQRLGGEVAQHVGGVAAVQGGEALVLDGPREALADALVGLAEAAGLEHLVLILDEQLDALDGGGSGLGDRGGDATHHEVLRSGGGSAIGGRPAGCEDPRGLVPRLPKRRGRAAARLAVPGRGCASARALPGLRWARCGGARRRRALTTMKLFFIMPPCCFFWSAIVAGVGSEINGSGSASDSGSAPVAGWGVGGRACVRGGGGRGGPYALRPGRGRLSARGRGQTPVGTPRPRRRHVR